MIFLLHVILLLGNWVLAEPSTPSLAQKQGVMRAIEDALAAHEALQVQTAEEESLRAKTLNGNSNALEKWHRAEMLRVKAKRELEQRMETLVSRTGHAYQLELDRLPTGAVSGGLLHGKTAKWEPVLDEAERHVIRVGGPKEGEEPFLGPRWKDDDYAKVLENGRVIIRLRALRQCVKEGHPGLLAAILDHEAVHYRQLVSYGWKSLEATERDAWSRTLAFADKWELGSTSEEREDRVAQIRAKYEEYRKKAFLGALTFGYATTSAYMSEEEEEANRQEWLLNLAPIEEDRKNLRDRIEAAARERRERVQELRSSGHLCTSDSDPASCRPENLRDAPGLVLSSGQLAVASGPRRIGELARAADPPAAPPGYPLAIAKPPPPAPPRLAEARGVSPFDGLKRLAERSCANPRELTQQQVDEALSWGFPNGDSIDPGSTDGLPLCVRQVTRKLLERNRSREGGITVYWLRGQVSDAVDSPRPPPPPPLPDDCIHNSDRCGGGSGRGAWR